MNILELLKKYRENNPKEREITDKFIDFYCRKGEKGFFRECLEGHFTGSMFVVNGDFTKTLLMNHKKLEKWINFGGHADGDLDILGVAIRELEEESGIKVKKESLEDFIDLDLQIIPERLTVPEHYHYDFRFLVSIDESAIINKQETEVNEIKWVKIDDLCKYEIVTGVNKIIEKLNRD